MKRTKQVLALVCALALTLSLAACNSSKGGSGELEPIKLGAILSQTGTNAHGGQQGLNAMNLLIKQVNEAGGIKGRQIELLVENTNSEPEQAVNGATKLTNENKVLALLGPDNGSTATAVKEQVAEVDEIVQISITGSSPKLTADNPRWYFRGATPSTYQTKGIADYLVNDLGFTRIAILCDDALTDQAESMVKDLASYNLEPVGQETHKTGNTNFNGQLLSVKESDPECIFFIGYPTECASAMKQASDMGITAQFAGSSGMVYKELINLAGGLANGIIASIGFTASNPDEAVQAFVTEYEKAYGETPEHAAGQAYDQLSLVLEAIRQCDLSFDPKDLAADRTLIRDWLENEANGYQGLSGVIAYTAEDHTAYKSVNLMTVEDGAWKVLRAAQ